MCVVEASLSCLPASSADFHTTHRLGLQISASYSLSRLKINLTTGRKCRIFTTLLCHTAKLLLVPVGVFCTLL